MKREGYKDVIDGIGSDDQARYHLKTDDRYRGNGPCYDLSSPPQEGLRWTTNLALYCMLFFPLKQAFFVLYRVSYRCFKKEGQSPTMRDCPSFLKLITLLFLCQEKFAGHLIPCIRGKGFGNT